VSVIRTKTNMVCAYEPEDDDLFVQVTWHGPPDEGSNYLRPFHGPLEPIDQYEATVNWAVSMAHQMRFPLHVVPFRAQDVMKTKTMQDAIARLSDHDRGELRRIMAAAMAEVMRDCDDPAIRADAYDLLLDMKVIRP
jgi:hypothetical protein